VKLGSESMGKTVMFLKENASVLLQSDAETWLLFDTLEKEMNGLHKECKEAARQYQLVVRNMERIGMI
jgi:hypothetical protein